MFVRYFLELPMPSARVEETLLREPETWLGAIAQLADRRRDQLLADVGIGELVRIERSVAITLGAPVRGTTKTVIPLSWRATGATANLFPTMEADIEVAPLDPRTTQLAISARYVPPLGLVGRMLDRAILHRIAEATLKDFLDHVAEAIRDTGRGLDDHEAALPG